jgi:hypothetical protein
MKIEDKYGRQIMVIKHRDFMSREQFERLRGEFDKAFPDMRVLLVPEGWEVELVKDDRGALDRIEGKLDQLLRALAEDEDPVGVDLQGYPLPDERAPGTSLG